MSGYGPQESWNEEDRRPFFAALDEEIEKAFLNGKSVIITMVANSKLGKNFIPNDPHLQSSNGNILSEIITKHNL